ncbi:hypothetical protein LTSEURB_2190 [Salmonella enterica subsp. enterica serovar Urbana str. R8-2977]|uniref:Uncharacterized protein n=1 Tax=Salmonella enterica subsp. enterica serovar Urbana str. R8-2977 TaxID=913084 RepID=G5RUW1_SALET|nr:hypothetical protein SeGA_2066 [Salmonella enterica subsp. enterica serovar Gaminara str. A4-567]EHC64889.1 hypothetical protein LTSEJOH_2451 [Salmonella enterica subsp. enterica serovar Johannesburg str. S5-703]EHC68575.1 hypothetical protein LTSEMIN_2548 [Salmonella enterica subsp. enterica serovar Minnesota str. A4-603]EHD04030.1 hypothetical protein LTSEURB_2190 [Salmonella enterica subsp. enterica serovar Urbana str. R8-2977]
MARSGCCGISLWEVHNKTDRNTPAWGVAS